MASAAVPVQTSTKGLVPFSQHATACVQDDLGNLLICPVPATVSLIFKYWFLNPRKIFCGMSINRGSSVVVPGISRANGDHPLTVGPGPECRFDLFSSMSIRRWRLTASWKLGPSDPTGQIFRSLGEVGAMMRYWRRYHGNLGMLPPPGYQSRTWKAIILLPTPHGSVSTAIPATAAKPTTH